MCINCIIHVYVCAHTEGLQASELLAWFSPWDLFRMPAVHSYSLRHPHCGTCQTTLVIPVSDLPASSSLLVGVTSVHWQSKRLGAVYPNLLQLSEAISLIGDGNLLRYQEIDFPQVIVVVFVFQKLSGRRLYTELACHIPGVLLLKFLSIFTAWSSGFCACCFGLSFFPFLFPSSTFLPVFPFLLQVPVFASA